MNPFQDASFFLINTLFDLYLMVLILRFFLALTRADYVNPITHFIVKITQPLVLPLRRFIPTYSNVEYATLVLIVLFDFLKFILISSLIVGFPKSVFGLLLLVFADCFKLIFNFFFYAIFLQVIVSWIHQGYSPLLQFLTQVTQPFMRPFQRLIPSVGGFDVSPIPALILLQLLLIIIAKPLFSLGFALTLGSLSLA